MNKNKVELIRDKSKQLNNHDKKLLSLISVLDDFSYLQGTEGKVFFVDDNFVVKHYFSKEEDAVMFNKFCKEIKMFSDMGYSVPKIYSWAAFSDDRGETNLYILEERVKGTILFESDMSSIYERCKDFCLKQEFDSCLNDGQHFQELFSQIVREYIKAFIVTNENLLNIPESEVEKFIASEHGMFTNSHYSIPDVQASNIMFDGGKLTIIDNGFLSNGLFFKDTPEQINAMVLRDMFFMFYENGSVREKEAYSPIYSQEIEKLKQKNGELCFENMRRFVKKAKSMLGYNRLGEYDYDACLSISREVLSEKLADELCKEIEKQ